MKVFVAGATGVIGRRLVAYLLGAGHDVVALVRTPSKGPVLEKMGARVVVGDALKAKELTEIICTAEPEAIVHQLTAIPPVTNIKKLDEQFSLTNRLRTEAADTMLAAARRTGARRFLVQSFCGWPFARQGGPVKTEDDPLDGDPPANFRKTLAAIQHLEDAVCGTKDLTALALRYGFFYGPGTSIATDGSIVTMVRRRQFPLVGHAGGVWSFIHIDDAARATAAAIERGAAGLYNIVDDEPALVALWLPYLAEVLGAPPPRRLPVWLASWVIGQEGVTMMTEIRGGSNAKAKRELAWEPAFASWRRGFREGLG
jgi:nucleoside-diphosphate-sugar epimerase